MALIDCPDCSTLVSSTAPSCPKCGFPVAAGAAKAVGTGRFDEVARAEGVDLSEFGRPTGPPHVTEAVLLSQRKKTNHVLHLLLTLVTGGLWLIVWLLVDNSNRRHNRQLDEKINAKTLR